jgi:hypothetical protein
VKITRIPRWIDYLVVLSSLSYLVPTVASNHDLVLSTRDYLLVVLVSVVMTISVGRILTR